MKSIKGTEYKLAGVDVYQKGTLVEVFAKFSRIDESLDDILAPAPKVREAPAKLGTGGEVFDVTHSLPRSATMPYLSAEDILNAVVGERDLQEPRRSTVELVDKSGVIADLGPEKLAQVLVKMGEVRRQVLEEGQSTFVPLIGPRSNKP